MKEVLITIHSLQDYDGEEDNSMEFTTDGLYSYENGTGRIRYYESEVTGLPGTRTEVSISPDEVIVDREGSITARMVFRKGCRNNFLYNTPYGTATMGIDTRKICHDLGEHGGSMEIDYVVDMEHVAVTRNKFKLNVREIR